MTPPPRPAAPYGSPDPLARPGSPDPAADRSRPPIDDVADLRRQIHSLETRLGDLFTTTLEGHVLVTTTGIVRSLNAPAVGMLGVARRWMIGKPITTRLAMANRIAFRQALIAMEHGRRPVAVEVGLLGSGRAEQTVRMMIHPLLGPSDVLDGAHLVLHDVTAERLVQRREVRRALDAVEQRETLRAVADSLTPPVLVLPDTELGVAMGTAGRGTPVGGDLHDWLVLPDGDLYLSIIDVTGRGASATRSALALASTLRVLIADGCALEDLLERAERAVTVQARGLLATAVVVRYRPSSGDLRLSVAGHPPPVIVRLDGATEVIEERGGLLGAGRRRSSADGRAPAAGRRHARALHRRRRRALR